MKQQIQQSRRFGWKHHSGVLAAAVALTAVALALPARADQWTKPTAEELNMKELPGHPGASAVVLFREKITKEDLHVTQYYERIKILTEKGRDLANIDLRFIASRGDGYYEGDEKSVGDITGRTIHADGSIIPFTGKPYLKTIQKTKDYSYQTRVFTMPDVEIGSIIEYRYAERISDHAFEAPDWYVQGDLFVRSAHYMWYPTTQDLMSEDGPVSNISWFQVLPAGVKLQSRQTPGSTATGNAQSVYELTVKDIEPLPEEEFMPPTSSFSYRVLFYYSPYRLPAEFWKSFGKRWSKRVDTFAGPDSALTAATQPMIAGASTPTEKLQKIYAAVMALENTEYTRDHDRKEDKAAGLGKVSSAADVLKHQRGNPTELTELFIGMARAAGLKAYAMIVPDREYRLFTPSWLDARQLDDLIAIVSVDGKDQFFDPGSRYCAFGHVAWQHSFVQGIRQTDSAPDFATSAGDGYQATNTRRIADLVLDEHNELSGSVTITYTGSTALRWRQQGLRGDEESLRHGLKTAAENMLPKTMDVKVMSIENATEYEKPLVVTYRVKGTAGSATGKRLILPADLFLADAGATFPHEKRETAVYFHFAQSSQDAVRIKFPSNLSVEGTPAASKATMPSLATYDMNATVTPNSVTVHRNLFFGGVIVPKEKYADLRAFYSQVDTKDKDSIVLKLAAATSSAPEATPASGTGN